MKPSLGIILFYILSVFNTKCLYSESLNLYSGIKSHNKEIGYVSYVSGNVFSGDHSRKVLLKEHMPIFERTIINSTFGGNIIINLHNSKTINIIEQKRLRLEVFEFHYEEEKKQIYTFKGLSLIELNKRKKYLRQDKYIKKFKEYLLSKKAFYSDNQNPVDMFRRIESCYLRRKASKFTSTDKHFIKSLTCVTGLVGTGPMPPGKRPIDIYILKGNERVYLIDYYLNHILTMP